MLHGLLSILRWIVRVTHHPLFSFMKPSLFTVEFHFYCMTFPALIKCCLSSMSWLAISAHNDKWSFCLYSRLSRTIPRRARSPTILHFDASGLSGLLHPGDSTFVCVAETCRSRFHTDGCSRCIEREPFEMCSGVGHCSTSVDLTTITFLWTAMHTQANLFSLACVLVFGLVFLMR